MVPSALPCSVDPGDAVSQHKKDQSRYDRSQRGVKPAPLVLVMA